MRRGWTWLLALSLSTCEGGSALSLDDYERAIVRRWCANFEHCGHLPSEEECHAMPFSGLGQVKSSVKAGKVHYDGAAAADCIAFYEANTNACTPVFSTRCVDTFRGTLEIGDACLMPVECKSGSCDMGGCDGDGACCRGTCIAGPRQVALGGNCSDGVCVAGAFCTHRPGDEGLVCHALLKEGETCGPAGICAFGLFCPPIDAGVAQVCMRNPNRGEPCNGLLSCDSAQDLCDPETLTCVPRRAVGDPCGVEAVCVGYAHCEDSVCVAFPKLGEPCDTDGRCQAFLVCSNDTCSIAPPPPICPP